MCGQEGYFGTNAFQVVLDIDKLAQVKAAEEWSAADDIATQIQDGFETLGAGMGVGETQSMCSIANLTIQSNVDNMTAKDLGQGDDTYDPGF